MCVKERVRDLVEGSVNEFMLSVCHQDVELQTDRV